MRFRSLILEIKRRNDAIRGEKESKSDNFVDNDIRDRKDSILSLPFLPSLH